MLVPAVACTEDAARSSSWGFSSVSQTASSDFDKLVSRERIRATTHAIDATRHRILQTKLLGRRRVARAASATQVETPGGKRQKRRLAAAARGPLARRLLARLSRLFARGRGGGGVALLLLDLSLRTGQSRRRRRKDAGTLTFFVAALASRAFWRAAFFAAS